MLNKRTFTLLLAVVLSAALLPQGNWSAKAAQKKRAGASFTMFSPDGTPLRPRAQKRDRFQGKTQKPLATTIRSSVTDAKELTAKQKRQGAAIISLMGRFMTEGKQQD